MNIEKERKWIEVKRMTAGIVAILLVLTIAGGFSAWAEKDFALSLADWNLWKEIPESGTVEVLRYKTHWYNGDVGTDYTKYMSVYIPYGYSPEQKYDVFVLIPGMNMSEECYLNTPHDYESGETDCVWLRNLFDNAIADGRMKPMIVVNVNYYGATWIGNPNMEMDSNNIAKELRYDILPVIIERYSTYAENGSVEAISAARDHFGVFGSSYSATMMPRTIMPECLDLFAWFGATSMFCEPLDSSIEYLNERTGEYPIRYFYCGCGDVDTAHDQTLAMYDEIVSRSSGLQQWFNTDLVVVPNCGHNAKAYDTAIYNCATIFFK